MGRAQSEKPMALVVEHDRDLRDLAEALLEESDLEVVGCESGEAALEVMHRRGGRVAFLFADVELAGAMDGVELARAVRERWPRVKIVVTSPDDDRLQGLPQGADHMPKPWLALEVLVAAEIAKAGQRLR